MSASIEFKDFGKISRFRTIQVTVTEKIDGTNAQVYIPDDPSEALRAGSRNRWVTPEQDNYGFARFVAENSELLRRLGPGRHFGEWYGAGIQRRYGLDHKRFALFNVDRFSGGLPEGLAEIGVQLVPVLYRGAFDSAAISAAVEKLYTGGSVLVPGFDKPEGAIVSCGGQRWKITDNGDQHKGCTTDHHEVVKAAAAVDRDNKVQKMDPRLVAAFRSITVTKLETEPVQFAVRGENSRGVPFSLFVAEDQIVASRNVIAKRIAESEAIYAASAAVAEAQAAVVAAEEAQAAANAAEEIAP